MFDKAKIRGNIEDAGFSEDDTAALLEGLESSKDEGAFRDFIAHMKFTGEYRIVYPIDTPWYRAFACIL